MIHNTADTIDSREIIERIEELETLAEAGESLTAEESGELAALTNLATDASGYAPDWEYGETLIHSDYFVEYVQELLTGSGYLPADLPAWIHVDWEKTADEVSVDYTEVNFAGQTYLIR